MSSGDVPEAVAKRLGYAVKRAQHALRLSMDDVLRPLSLTTPQYAVLSALEAEPGLSNARLARAAFVTAQTMQGILANLERNGLIERSADPRHGRILRSSLTKLGAKALARAHLAVGAIERKMVASFGENAAQQIAHALTKCAVDLRSSDAADDAE